MIQDVSREGIDSSASDAIVATPQAKEVGNEEAGSTIDGMGVQTLSGPKDDLRISSSDYDELPKMCEDMQETSSVQSEEGHMSNDMSITIDSSSNVTNAVENLNVETLKSNGKQRVQEEEACAEKILTSSNMSLQATSLSGSFNESGTSTSDQRPKGRTVSFKIETTTTVKETSISLSIQPQEMVISSCSISPSSELEEEDMVFVHPVTEQVSYRPSRKRVKSGLDSTVIKSANSVLRKFVNTDVDMTDLEDTSDSPVPRVSTFDRYRNTFSWNRGRSFTRQSFAHKNKGNHLSFHNIGYTVQQKKFFRVIGTKVILKNVRYVI